MKRKYNQNLTRKRRRSKLVLSSQVTDEVIAPFAIYPRQRMSWVLGKGEKMFVKSNIVTAIRPSMIHVNTNGSSLTCLLGTLDKSEFEAAAGWMVVHSEEMQDQWMAFVRPDRGEYQNMIDAGFLTEVKVDEGWRYELTLLAIEQIYIRQQEAKIKRLTAHIQELEKVTA